MLFGKSEEEIIMFGLGDFYFLAGSYIESFCGGDMFVYNIFAAKVNSISMMDGAADEGRLGGVGVIIRYFF